MSVDNNILIGIVTVTTIVIAILVAFLVSVRNTNVATDNGTDAGLTESNVVGECGCGFTGI